MYPFSKSYIEKDIKKEIDNDDYDEIARNYNLDKIKTYGLL